MVNCPYGMERSMNRMSQKKVDMYKQEKANRKQIMHKQRVMGP